MLALPFWVHCRAALPDHPGTARRARLPGPAHRGLVTGQVSQAGTRPGCYLGTYSHQAIVITALASRPYLPVCLPSCRTNKYNLLVKVPERNVLKLPLLETRNTWYFPKYSIKVPVRRGIIIQQGFQEYSFHVVNSVF